MKKDERIERVNEVMERFFGAFEELCSCKNHLEELGFVREANSLDVIDGNLYNLYYKIKERRDRL